MNTKPSIAIIGAGNMGNALAGGLIKNHYPAKTIWLSDPSEEKLAVLQKSLGVNITTDNNIAIQESSIVILAVKPQIISTVAQSIAPLIQTTQPLVLSIAAGIRTERLQEWLGNVAIVRAMPNTPCLIGCGATGLYANSQTNTDQHQLAESIMRTIGVTVWLEDEKLMDVVTALSGSGPAYFFLIIEAMQKAAENMGLPADVAELLTLQTAYGAARMAMENDHPVDELRQHVTSPGGTTERAIKTLEEGHIHQLFANALKAAKERSEELSKL